MLYGQMVMGKPLVTGEGLPIQETDPPEYLPEGHELRESWSQTATAIVQVWTVVPTAGTVEDSAVNLARMLAEDLTDEQALRVPALYDEWSGEGVEYKEGMRRMHKGTLYRCLQDHTSQGDWAPDAAPSLWAKVLPGQSGEVGPWEQPGSTNGYAEGSKVTHVGHLWKSDVDDNVWEPGAVGAPWTDLGPVE